MSEYMNNVSVNENRIVTTFTPRPFTKALVSRYSFYCDGQDILYYYDKDSGLWKNNAEKLVESELRKDLIDENSQKSYFVKEIIKDLKGYIYDPNNPSFPIPKEELIPFNDGVYDLDAKEFKPFDPSMYFTTKLPVNYNPKAECKMIDQIFSEIVDNPIVLYELIGYCLYRGYPYQKFFFLYGKGGNGKSLFLNILRKALGERNVVPTNLEILEKNRFAYADFYQKLVAHSAESMHKILNNTEPLKLLTGGDCIRAERKFGQPFRFVNYAKLIIAANELPKTMDKTHAFYRRVHLIEFPNVIAGTAKEDRRLLDKIPESEFEGLIFKALNLLIDLRNNGFHFKSEPDERALRKEYEALSDPLSVFIDEFCESDPNGVIPKKIFKYIFNKYQEVIRVRKWNESEIGKEMKRLGFESCQRSISPENAWHTFHKGHTLFKKVLNMDLNNLKKGMTPMTPIPKKKKKSYCWEGLNFKEVVSHENVISKSIKAINSLELNVNFEDFDIDALNCSNSKVA